MFDLIKQVIESKAYKLEDMLYKINKMYIESYITEEEKTELDNLSRKNADPVNSYAPLEEQINKIYLEINEIKETINELKGIEESVEPSEDEYPEFVQPTGAHNCYNKGSKITFEGEKKICNIDGCVWSPAVYPAAWRDADE